MSTGERINNVQAQVQSHPTYLQAKDKTNYYLAQLDKELSKYPVMNAVEQRTQVPKTYIALGAVALLAFSHTFNALAAPTSNLVGFALPAYLSVRAIESPGAQDDVQWLTYWVVFGFFNFLESFCLRVVLYYFPWYFAFKSLFVIWLQLPAFRGAQTLYFSAFKPVLSKQQVSTRPDSASTYQADTLRDRVATANVE
ncbi:hypothetical protein PUNSTDRAFT_94272 [Punctularia strigosozonata HHB-11173 SS5]|uniref:uncharacterized protein n=1 Tax=Punctularia strigosozonata (strain HHB-11173) TaxID=741275 RepID=UPI0004417671|nr:uncharacterized protein PUNSTDRAFT_94272 [Punctularia strigosozonata HHB-11173 SS5]EIN13271.1 hypothetical protein PUNSTDRAFT_94272 [Punctularia strigosozonata HHB-11173 SS5]